MAIWTPGANALMPVDLSNPVNRDHPLAPKVWYRVLPGLGGGRFWNDLLGLTNATFTTMGNANNGWRSTTRKGGDGDVLFDGTAGYADAGTPPTMNFYGECTLSGWGLFTATGANRGMCGQLDAAATASQGAFQRQNPDKMSVRYGSGGSFINLIGATALLANTWYHYLFTRAGSSGSWTIILYVNGVSDGSTTSAINPSSQEPFSIGKYGALAGQYWNGRVDDVMWHPFALNASQVQALYISGLTSHPNLLNRIQRRFYSVPGGVVAIWRRTLTSTPGKRPGPISPRGL